MLRTITVAAFLLTVAAGIIDLLAAAMAWQSVDAILKAGGSPDKLMLILTPLVTVPVLLSAATLTAMAAIAIRRAWKTRHDKPAGETTPDKTDA